MSARLNELRELQETLATRSKEIILSAVKEFFDNQPEAKKITWTQYAPYFNDGDECEFSVNAPSLTLVRGSSVAAAEDVDQDPEEDEDDDDYYDAIYFIKNSTNLGYHKDKPDPTPEQRKLVEEFTELSSILQSCEDVMRMTFGNHVKVIATRDGFDTEEYEHD